MRVICRVLVIALCSMAALAAATKPDAAAKLDDFLRGLTGLEGDFRQIVKDAQGRKVEESTGTLAILRPNRFRWDYREPHEQVIVADGERLWLYDKDLEQVTVRKLEQTLAGTPAMLLSGEGDLRASFKVERSETHAGVEWLTLTPKRNDTEFKRVRLGLRGQSLVAMELADKLSQVTLIEFSNLQRNPEFARDRFAFAPPPGVDVIGETAQP